MEKIVLPNRKYYMSEFSHFENDHNVTFNIVDIDFEKKDIAVAITNQGKISIVNFDLKWDIYGYYFEYGFKRYKMSIDDFEQVEPDTCPF